MLERSREALLRAARPRPDRFDVAVIGAGMGGWAGARAARSRGKRVALFESGPIGGT